MIWCTESGWISDICEHNLSQCYSLCWPPWRKHGNTWKRQKFHGFWQFGFFYPVWLFSGHGLAFFLKRCLATLAQPSQTHSRSQFLTCCCAVWKWCVFLQVHYLMPDDRLERKRKGSSKNRNAIWKTYLLFQYFTSLQNENEKPVSGLLKKRLAYALTH